jgi:hypothetical protein
VPWIRVENNCRREQAYTHHHKDGRKPDTSKKDDPPSIFQFIWHKPKDTVHQLVGSAVEYGMPAITARVKGAVKGALNGLVEYFKMYSFFGLIALFALLVVSAFTGTSLANGSLAQK